MDRHGVENLLAARWPNTPIASTAALRDAGITDRHLSVGVRFGAIVRLRHGVYMPAHLWSALKPWDQDDARIDAHIAGTQGSPVYCLSSAAIIHGLSVWGAGSMVHVATGYAGSRASRASDTVTHQMALSDADIVATERGGRTVRLTSLLRTVVDCLRFLPHEQALVIGDNALHRQLVSVDEIRVALLGGSQRGRRRALAVVEALEPKTESVGESRTRRLLEKLGFARPVSQLVLMTVEGQYRADFAWPELRIIVEFDGEGKYMDYEPTAAVLLSERRRENLLMEQGWIFVRLRWSDLDHPEEVRRRIESAIARAHGRSA